MHAFDLIRAYFRYSDWATKEVLAAAGALSDAQLDQPFDMGPGTIRRTLEHIHQFEAVYLERWSGRVETPWPACEERVSIVELSERFRSTWRGRERFLVALTDEDLKRVITWRDSRGSLFQAELYEALLQVGNHSTHHRAQAVNMIRRVGGPSLEVDYMMHIRTPA